MIYQTVFTIHSSSGIRIGAVTRDVTEVMRWQQEIQALNAQLLQAYGATIEGWANALELRDQETTGHPARYWQNGQPRYHSAQERAADRRRMGGDAPAPGTL